MTALGARPAPQARKARWGERGPAKPGSLRAAVRSAWDSPAASYYLILSITLFLLALGLLFVLSSSTIYSLNATQNASGGATPLRQFLDQGRYALLGLPLAILASRLPVRVIRAAAWPAYLAAIGVTGLTFVLGEAVGGNRGWISLGAVRLQPAEFVKLALALWLGLVLSQRLRDLGRVKGLALPLVGGFLLVALQLYVTSDLGTVLIMMALMFGALWVAGTPLRVFLTLLAGAGSVALFYAVTIGETRMARIQAALGMGELNEQLSWQINHSLQALGTGGVSGVGLGGSRSKWLYLPAAQNDFIFAVIGEELGLAGTLLVLAVFAALAVGLARVILRSPDPFVKITTAGIAAWLLAQALVNVGVVTGVFPVIGVPLPLVSAGGSSLIATLIALGIVLAFARNEPGAPEALRARRGVVRRSFGVLASGLRPTPR